MNDEATATPRKPVIALMGEFSAGKSTLTNLLIGKRSLPVQVTATQLPPVWISLGEDAPHRIDFDNAAHPVDLNQIEDIPLDDTRYIQIQRNAELLEFCDLIDMPGISDPNMSAEVWQRVLHHADAVIWCTHATQAWRQSEAAVWDTLPDDLRKRSLLLLTRFDKIVGTRDRARVVRRVAKETAGLFAGVYPISLTQALSAGDNRGVWEQSGAATFISALIDLLHELAELDPNAARPMRAEAGQGEQVIQRSTAEPEPEPEPEATVMPRRVMANRPVRPRPPRPERPDPHQRPPGDNSSVSVFRPA